MTFRVDLLLGSRCHGMYQYNVPNAATMNVGASRGLKLDSPYDMWAKRQLVLPRTVEFGGTD